MTDVDDKICSINAKMFDVRNKESGFCGDAAADATLMTFSLRVPSSPDAPSDIAARVSPKMGQIQYYP